MPQRLRPAVVPVLVLAGFALLLAAFVAARPPLPIDETRYLDVAWEMWLSGDPVHLTRDFAPYAHKPPLLFWLINLVWLVTGVSEVAARLVGPAAAVGLLAATGALARRLWPQDAGIAGRAMAVLAGFMAFAIYGSLTMFDALLGLAVVAGIAALWRIGQTGGAEEGARPGRRAWLGLGAAIALGLYAKGPVILLHLGPPLLLLRLWAPSPPGAPEALRGTAIALGTAAVLFAAWVVPALATASPELRAELLWTQTADRLAGGLAHDRPVWFLLALLPLLLFPWAWSPALLRALPGVVRADAAGRLAAVWAAGPVLLFSLVASKQAHYLLPELPAAALVFARALPRAGLGRRAGAGVALLPLALGLGAAALALGLVPREGVLAALEPAGALALAAGLALTVGIAAARLPRLAGGLVAGAGTAAVLHLAMATTGLRAEYDGAEIARRLAAAAPGGLAFVGAPDNAEFNFAARLTAPVAVLAQPEALAAWAADHPRGLVFGPVDRAGIAAAPAETLSHAGRQIGFWPALSVRE